ncbi:MAG TPA: GspH/FimT family pseudopilin [Herbaspirillum sp.]|jgi:type IV fimbrial biogenesis protein FimT
MTGTRKRLQKANDESPAKAAGFTLIELMIVLAIAGLALTLAIPAFQEMTGRQQLNTAAADLLHAIQLTRSEALRRNRTVRLAPLDDADWTQGWRIYVGSGESGPYRDGDRLILQRTALPAGLRIENRSGAPPEIHIAYNGGGRSVRRNGMRLANSWYLRWKEETRIIVVNAQGRVRICDPARDHGRCER